MKQDAFHSTLLVFLRDSQAVETLMRYSSAYEELELQALQQNVFKYLLNVCYGDHSELEDHLFRLNALPGVEGCNLVYRDEVA